IRFMAGGIQIQQAQTNNWIGGTVVLNPGMRIETTGNTGTSNIAANGYLGMAGGAFVGFSPLVNSGRIVFSDPSSILSLSMLINNGTISGTGQVSAAVTNSGAGRITTAAADNLQFSGTLNNSAIVTVAGQLGAGSITNSGSIQLQGGNLTAIALTNQAG